MSTVTEVIEMTMPRLSDQMEEASIVRWLAAAGEEVAAGAELLEVETDKATVIHEAEGAGVLEILVAEGETVALGAPIARIHPVGTDLDASPAAPAPESESAPEPPSAPAPTAAAALPAAPAPATPPAAGGERRNVSPLARRIAAELGVDPSLLQGSGPGGRVVKADVLAASAPTPAPPTPPAPPVSDAPEPGDGGRGAVTSEELSRGQVLIARRMAETKATVPEFTTTIKVDMEPALRLREQLREETGAQRPPSLNDFVVKSVSKALRDVPRANGSYVDGRFELYGEVNVGIAVSRPDGLLVPVLREADRMSLGTIAAEARRLATAVREGTITPPDLAKGTFTVSNLGMFGIESFTAIINQGQAGILAVGAAERGPVARGDELALGTVSAMTLTADHRILYGADAARFLVAVRDRLERPLELLV